MRWSTLGGQLTNHSVWWQSAGLVRGVLVLLFLLAFGAGCSRDDRDGLAEAANGADSVSQNVDTEASVDTSGAVPPDSLEKKEDERGFFARQFNKEEEEDE